MKIVNGKRRMTSGDVHSDAYVYRCRICDNDYADYSPKDLICDDCLDKAEEAQGVRPLKFGLKK